MTLIKLQGKTIETTGSLPKLGSEAPSFSLVNQDLKESNLEDFKDKPKILNIFPSIDTPVCSLSVKKFIKELQEHSIYLLNISADLPFALKRFCLGENLNENQTLLSCFRSTFSQDYHVYDGDRPIKRSMCQSRVCFK